MPTDEEILRAFRQLSAQDRVELSGLDMPFKGQVRNRSLWLGHLRGKINRNLNRTAQVQANAITPKEQALSHVLQVLGAKRRRRGEVSVRPASRAHSGSSARAVIPTEEDILQAFRGLPTQDRVELSGLDMPIEGQERNRGLWVDYLRRSSRRYWNRLDLLNANATTPKEQAWCRFLALLGAPSRRSPHRLVREEREFLNFASRDEQRQTWTRQLYKQFVESREVPSASEAVSRLEWLRSWRVRHWAVQDQARFRFVREFLSAVGAGEARHDLRLLDGAYFPWPSTEAAVTLGKGTSIDAPMQAIGVLKATGYVVGRAGLPVKMRLRILSGIYTDNLTVQLDKSYLAEWGRPGTATRLRKLAHTLATLTRNMKRRKADAPSIDDWESDLKYLKHTHYDGVYDFKWPVTK